MTLSGPGFHKFHIGRGLDSHFAGGRLPEEPSLSLAWITIAPDGRFQRWPRSRVRRFWLRLRGWTFYDGDGNRS